MSDRRYRALLIGNWHYPEDPANLPDLKGPLNDVSRLAEVLADPTSGLFAPADVTALTERASYEITAELEQFFGEASRTDVLFVYYSGHGLTADDGSLLLCGRNARTDRKLASTVPAETINRMIKGCAAAAVVIVLDCCHAGAFKSGEFAADLAGKGRFVLAASRSRDRAPDAEHATGLSRFTGHLLRGLRGEALPPGTDHVTLSDLYRYVHRRMLEDGPIIPQRRFDGDGDIPLARYTPVAAPPGGLTVSETLIDVGEIRPGEVLPPERVYVTSTGGWTAETEADWVTLRPAADHLELVLAPRPDASRANVIVRSGQTGEARTIRIVARVVTAAAPGKPAPVGTVYGSARPPEPSAFTGRPSGPLGAAEVAAVTRDLDRLPGVAVRPGSVSRAEARLRRQAGVGTDESTLAFVDFPTRAGGVLLTNRALYLSDGNSVAVVPYPALATREIRLGPGGTHVDLGDGVQRLVGTSAPGVVDILRTVQRAVLA